MRVVDCYQFRLTRNSDLFVDEEEVKDLRAALRGELPQRQFGDEVRLEVADNCPANIERFLLDHFGLGEEDLYRVEGPVNLVRLMSVPDGVDRPDLKFAPLFLSAADARPRERHFEALRAAYPAPHRFSLLRRWSSSCSSCADPTWWL